MDPARADEAGELLERRHRLARPVPGTADVGQRQERDDYHGGHRRQEVRQAGRAGEGRGHGDADLRNGVGAGKLGATSQTLGVTSFSKYPKQAAAFIKYLHTPDRLSAFYKATGALPADDRFNANLIKLPQIKQLFTMAKAGGPYLENFIPFELDQKGNFAGVQLLLAGKMTATQAAAAMESNMARIRLTNPKEIANFKVWGAQ